jgi:peptide/nickel transport system substrate-binding protein
MDETQRRVDDIRRARSELENHLIDEYVWHKISRREFIRRGTVVGMSIPLLGFIAAACGGDDGEEATPTGTTGTGTQPAGDVQQGGNFRVAVITPATAPNPLLVQDLGGSNLIGTPGEYLSFADENRELQPRLAESWEPNEDGSVWTFKIRQGVSFHDGTPMTANDVVQTFEKLIAGSANAQSNFAGVLTAGNATAVDDATVEFQLEAPNGSFPTLVSSANYNAIIIPADLDPADWPQTFIGTGPFRYESFQNKVGATFVRNDDYWDSSRIANFDSIELKFYDEEAPMILALQGGEVDFIGNFSVSGGQALLNDPNVQVLALKVAYHRQIHMRNDKEPFTDKRVRQAIAFAIDRQALVDGLWEGRADLGNDSPFAPGYPSTDPSVPQRVQDLDQARQLLADAGMEGFSVELNTWNGFEIPDLAELVKAAAAEIGVTINLSITDPATYYGDGVFGKSTWLDSVMGITDFGDRPVPNVFLSACYLSDQKVGTYNAAHFRNSEYDGLYADYVAALDVDSQRAVAKQIQELLLDETPIVIPYFYNFLAAAAANVEPGDAVSAQYEQAGFTA